MSVDALTARFRQSVQTCTSHLAGPAVAWDAILAALYRGDIDQDDLREIGKAIITESSRSYEQTDDPKVRRREAMTIRFCAYMFSLPWTVDLSRTPPG